MGRPAVGNSDQSSRPKKDRSTQYTRKRVPDSGYPLSGQKGPYNLALGYYVVGAKVDTSKFHAYVGLDVLPGPSQFLDSIS